MRSTSKGKDVNYNKLNEGSPLPHENQNDDDINETVVGNSKKLSKKLKKKQKEKLDVLHDKNNGSSSDELSKDCGSVKYAGNVNKPATVLSSSDGDESDEEDDIDIINAKNRLKELQKKEEKKRNKEEKLTKEVG